MALDGDKVDDDDDRYDSVFRRPSGSMALRSHSDTAGKGERAPE